jgi:hypothetical protein
MGGGRFIVTILIRLISHISYITPIVSLPQPPPIPLKAIARGFFVLSHICIWSPSTIYPHLNLLHSPFPLPLVHPTHTVPNLQSCLSLLIFKLIYDGVSQCIPTVGILYFGLLNPFHYSPLSLYLLLPIFNSFQYTTLYPLPSQMLCLTILLMLYYSLFLSLFPQVP